MFRFVELKKENGRREGKSGKRSSLFDAEKEENRDFIQNVLFRATILQRKKADEKRRSTRSSLLNIRHLCKEENRDFISNVSCNDARGMERKEENGREER